MNRTPLAASDGPTVHELQDLAREAASPRRRRTPEPSRAARLHLIDILSRWGGSGLALMAGVAIFVAVMAGRAYPFRAAVWLLVTLAALHVCRALRKRFRAGERISARPFRWRADYTAALSVLSAAFGAGALIALPQGAPPELAFQTLAALLAGSLGAGIAHAAHGRAAAAAAAPAAAFLFLGAWRTAGLEPALIGLGAAAATGGAALFLFRLYLRRNAVRRFPRTTFVRREPQRAARKNDSGQRFPAAGAQA